MAVGSRVAFFALLISMAPIEASAISVEVAKKCEALLAKQFPPRVVGNPAAGSAKGSAEQQRTFFQKCVANGGTVDEGSPSKSN